MGLLGSKGTVELISVLPLSVRSTSTTCTPALRLSTPSMTTCDAVSGISTRASTHAAANGSDTNASRRSRAPNVLERNAHSNRRQERKLGNRLLGGWGLGVVPDVDEDVVGVRGVHDAHERGQHRVAPMERSRGAQVQSARDGQTRAVVWAADELQRIAGTARSPLIGQWIVDALD